MSRVKPLIIGEAPGKHGDASKPVEGRIGARLAACFGLTLEEFLEAFDRVNLLQGQPQDSGRGTNFNVKEAGRVARSWEQSDFIDERPLVLLLGKRVAAAFKFTNAEYFVKVKIAGATTYVVPHPSGVSRWWNELENELTMIRFMHQIVKEINVSRVGR